MSNDITPKRTHRLKSENQIKSYIHPTRLNILKMLAKEKRTVSGVAKEMGVHPANITHHIKLLEKNGLIKLVEKRDIGRNIEKYYRAIAHNYSVQISNDMKINKEAFALSILKDDMSIAVESLKNKLPSGSVTAYITTARIDQKKLDLFGKKLANLIQAFKAGNHSGGTATTINLSIYPNDTDSVPGDEEVIIK
jgi:DNA-binding transcriptional ArsR family regulator